MDTFFDNTPTIWQAPTLDDNAELSLVVAIKQIVKAAEDSQLCAEFFECAARPIAYICERMSLSQEETVFFCLFASKSNAILDADDMAHFFGFTILDAMLHIDAVDSLIEKGLVSYRERATTQYKLHSGVLNAIAKNQVYVQPRYDNLTIEELFNRIHKVFAILECNDDQNDYDRRWEIIRNLWRKNGHLDFVSKLKALELPQEEECFFLLSCDMLVSNDDYTITKGDVVGVWNSSGFVFRFWKKLQSGQTDLIKKNLWQPCNENGVASTNSYELTDYVRNEMLQGLGVERVERKSNMLTSCDSITAKELFYNPKEERSLSQLVSLLQPEKFASVCDRLEQKGLRRGFACLFYGGPGTGKTETVLQLARQTGRDLMQVDLANIRSKWVGESEKNVKAIFDTYRHLVKNCEHTPILFFNEADAVISKRNEGVERAVDKMENSIQNIILQEMENLEGILIATTNLTKNMDSAFERRFLYKIEFQKPSAEAKRAIWQTMIPSLSAEDAAMLAAKYDFSGGQIENVARKHAVEEVLWGVDISLDRLVEFCNEERLGSSEPQRRIGFIQ